MEDVYDLRSLLFGIADKTVTKLLTGTPLESHIETISFGLGTFVIVNVVFLMLFFSQFAILWIERKWCARMQDRRGATTALRSLWLVKMVKLQVNGGTCFRSEQANQLVC